MRKETTVIVNGNKEYNIKRKLAIIIILIVIAIFMTSITINKIIVNRTFSKEVNDFTKLNAKTVFSIDKIYLYSSANATSNSETRPIWNLNLFQYTDIALYINNNSNDELNNENAIKELYIDKVNYTGPKVGETALYYKDINDFAKSSKIEENKIQDKLDFKILKTGDLDYSKPQIYSDASSPITLEYVNNNIKQNEIISDISSEVKYDGNLLRKSGVILSDIECQLSFHITIVNYYNQKFVANVYIDIPLENSATGDTIYNGKIVKQINKTNQIRFFRIAE